MAQRHSGILFLIDFVKSKPTFKNYIFPSILFILASVVIVVPLIGAKPLILNFDTFQSLSNSLIYGIIFIPLVIFLLLNKSFKSLFFAVFTYTLLTLCFVFVYQGSFWHTFFYVIYWLIALWIAFMECENCKFKKFIEIFASLIFAVLIFFPITKQDKISTNQLFGTTRRDILTFILNNGLILNSPLILTYDEKTQALLNYPQINEKLLINYCSDDDFIFFKQYKKAENPNCYTENGKKRIVFSNERFDEILDAHSNSKNIFFLAFPFENSNFIYKTKNGNWFEVIEYRNFDSKNTLYQIKNMH